MLSIADYFDSFTLIMMKKLSVCCCIQKLDGCQKENCPRRFYSLFNIIVEFFQDFNSVLCDELRIIKHDIAYLSDVFTKLNEVNLQLQGNDINLIKAKSAIPTFLFKLQLFKQNLARHELYQFSSLSDIEKKSIPDDDLQVYCAHLEE